MSRRTKRITKLSVLGTLVATIALGADERLEKLGPEHRTWLEEEVVYIITERERDVFLSLETVEERDLFIEAFWRKRDPNRATLQNEFKEEHYRRLEYANKFLGRETFREGWQTDRGRYYIILGEPREIQRFDGYNELVSSELWFYQGGSEKGLPSFFYLLFFKRHDLGEYELYHPLMDGPAQLMRGPMANNPSPRAALDVIERISPELARASLSFDTSDPADYMVGRGSIGSDAMLARIEESPKRAIRTDYADAWIRYGRKVSADYSFNFIPSRSSFGVLVGPQSTPFVHYSIEIDPEDFTLETDENQTKFYTTLDVSVEVTDPEERLIVANYREAYLELTPDEIDKVRTSPFAYQDNFPLVPGEFTVTVILRNRVTKQYTVAERALVVPAAPSNEPWVMDILAGYDRELVAVGQKEGHRSFEIDDVRLHPAADRVFVLGDTIHAMVQAHDAGRELELRISLLDGDEILEEHRLEPNEYRDGVVVEEFPLLQMTGGRYRLQAELVEPSGRVVARSSTDVQVSPRSSVLRSEFVYRRGFNAAVPGLLALARGEQLMKLGRNEEALRELESSVAVDNSRLPMARWKLAELLLRRGEADRVFELLGPLESRFPKQFEVIAGLGFASYLKSDYQAAVSYLGRAMTLRPPDAMLLNALADSHDKTGNRERARELYERSLEMDPGQDAVKSRLASLGQGASK